MYEKQTLPNGVRIIYEHMPHVRSAAIGVWIGVGSRYESPCEAGSAHFIEHMLFKGTAQHSASELAERMDAIGGQVNAYTTREGTCYYARVLDEHLDRAGDLLAEMLFTSNFAEADVANERGVIREEMDMYADTPEDLVTERLIGAAFPGALGRPVLGRPASIDRLTGARLRSFQSAHYIAPRIVIAVSGSFTDENIARLAAHFSFLPRRPDLTMRSGSYTPAFTLKRKAIEQNQISIGFPGLPTGSEARFTMALLSSILGGNMSFRPCARKTACATPSTPTRRAFSTAACSASLPPLAARRSSAPSRSSATSWSASAPTASRSRSLTVRASRCTRACSWRRNPPPRA